MTIAQHFTQHGMFPGLWRALLAYRVESQLDARRLLLARAATLHRPPVNLDPVHS